ncbi:endonuclease domain-containing protein [Saccharopolyspora kobensis]
MLQPACWSWPADPVTLDQLRAEAALTPTSDSHVLPEQRASYATLERWHNDRCAVCGEVPKRGRLVRDHDHASGTIRGLLCNSCNITEARSPSVLFANYRKQPPSSILKIEVLYLPAGFQPGAGHLPAVAKDTISQHAN